MRLATAQDCVIRAGHSDAADTTLMFESCLAAATVLIQTYLDTDLYEATVQDHFDFASLSYSTPGPFTELRLSRGYLRTAPKVFFSTNGLPVDDNVPDSNALDSRHYSINLTDGLLTLFAAPPPGARSVMVRYTAGFQDEENDIPTFIREAAIAGAIAINQTHNRGYRNIKTPDNAANAHRVLYQMLQHRARQRRGQWPSATQELP